MSPKKVWITPHEAALIMSHVAGYEITSDDIKQLRRQGKIKKFKKLNAHFTLYHIDEVLTVRPPKKRNPKLLNENSKSISLESTQQD